MENIINLTEAFVREKMPNDAVHGYQHVDRVRNHALRIARAEAFGDLEAVELAALLHDIGRSQDGLQSSHGQVGVETARAFLLGCQFEDNDRLENICNAIRFHNHNRQGEGQLLGIVRDADILDLLGAVGVMRAFVSMHAKPVYDSADIKGETWRMTASDFDRRFDTHAGIGSYIIDQLNFQLSCIDNLSTATAKQLAAGPAEYLSAFILELEQEIKA